MKPIEKKAQQHAQKALQGIIDKYQSAPWNEFCDALAEIYLAGASEALKGQWHDADKEKPEIGQEIVWHVRVKTPRGTWIDGFIADTYCGEYEPEGVWYWMPIPELPRIPEKM